MEGERGIARDEMMRRLRNAYADRIMHITEAERDELQRRANAANAADAHEVVLSERVIALWKKDRKTRRPGPRAIATKERSCGGCSNFSAASIPTWRG